MMAYIATDSQGEEAGSSGQTGQISDHHLKVESREWVEVFKQPQSREVSQFPQPISTSKILIHQHPIAPHITAGPVFFVEMASGDVYFIGAQPPLVT